MKVVNLFLLVVAVIFMTASCAKEELVVTNDQTTVQGQEMSLDLGERISTLDQAELGYDADDASFRTTCPAGPAPTMNAVFNCNEVTVSSTARLSRVILQTSTGNTYSFCNLVCNPVKFIAPVGIQITKVWIVSGGYYTVWDAPADSCDSNDEDEDDAGDDDEDDGDDDDNDDDDGDDDDDDDDNGGGDADD